jgi:uncharacterized protein YndB with AHSA1/START domain
VPEKRDSAGDISGVTVQRVLNAPIAVVFKAWTDPKHVEQWWGPHQFTNKIRKWEARAGGPIDIDMIGPDGTAYPMNGTFTEVSEPSRLVFKSAVPGPDGKPIFEVLTVITLTESGSRTTLTMQATVTSRTDAAAQFLKGMEAGWTQSLERLDALVTRIGGDNK